MKYKKILLGLFFTFPSFVYAISALTIAGAGAIIVGTISVVTGGAGGLAALAISLGIHAFGMGLVFDDPSPSTPEGLPMPSSPTGSPGSIMIDLGAPPLGKKAQIDSMVRNPETPVYSYGFTYQGVPGANNKTYKFADLQGAEEGIAEIAKHSFDAQGQAYYYTSGKMLCDSRLANSCFSAKDSMGVSPATFADCADGYYLSGLKCVIGKDPNAPKYINKPAATPDSAKPFKKKFQPNPTAVPPTAPPTISPDGSMFVHRNPAKPNEAIVIINNDDGSTTLTNVKDVGTEGGQAAQIWTMNGSKVTSSTIVANPKAVEIIRKTDSTLIIQNVDGSVSSAASSTASSTNSSANTSTASSSGTSTASSSGSSATNTGGGGGGGGGGGSNSSTGSSTASSSDANTSSGSNSSSASSDGTGKGCGNSQGSACIVNFGGVGDYPQFGTDGNGGFDKSNTDNLLNGYNNGTNQFTSLISWRLPVKDAKCPTYKFNFFGVDVLMDSHCSLFNDNSETFRSIFKLIFTLMALFIVLSA